MVDGNLHYIPNNQSSGAKDQTANHQHLDVKGKWLILNEPQETPEVEETVEEDKEETEEETVEETEGEEKTEEDERGRGDKG